MLDETPKPPIVVNPSVAGASITMAIRQLALVGGGFASAAGFLRSKDWVGFFEYLAGDGFIAVCIALVTIAVFVYGQYRLWRDRQKGVTIARSVSDDVAVVKGDKPK